MKRNIVEQGAVRRAINDLVMAEMFLVQATVESAAAIGDGVDRLSRTISADPEHPVGEQPMKPLLRHIAAQALEPYSSRLQYFRQMRKSR
ncbi:MAG: hypothetical protein U5K56_06245 [Halioglobus sp.]|nr:hypothetical protein [Halioglobus sp.]